MPIKIEWLLKEREVAVGKPVRLRLRLTDAETGQPKTDLKDVRVLFFLAPGVWQKRDFARHIGEGMYEVSPTPPEGGAYMAFVEVLSLGVAFRQLPHLTLRAGQ